MTTTETDDKLVGDLKTVVKDAQELMDATASQSGAEVSQVRRRLAAALDSAKATCQRLEEKTIATAKATDRVIRDHPYESIGVAFGVGILVGVLIARK